MLSPQCENQTAWNEYTIWMMMAINIYTMLTKMCDAKMCKPIQNIYRQNSWDYYSPNQIKTYDGC